MRIPTLKKLAAMLAAAVLAPAALEASGAAGVVAAPYLKLPMGARSTGMGEAFTGLADDTSALYYNPAGLTQIDATMANFMHLQGFGGINYEYVSLVSPSSNIGLDVWGTLGFFYEMVSIEEMQRTKTKAQAAAEGIYDPDWQTDPDGYSEAYGDRNYTFTSGATVVGLSYAWQATKEFSVGGTVKFINEKVDTKDGMGIAADLGMQIKTPLIPGLSSGVTLQNLGKSPSSAPLPVLLRAGAAYRLKNPIASGDIEIDHLLVSADFILPVTPIDGAYKVNAGMEYGRWFGPLNAAIRAGYRYPTDLDTMSGMTAGGGLGFDVGGSLLALDYAYVPYGVLGCQHRVGLTGTFGVKPRPTPTPDKAEIPQGVQVTAGDKSAQVVWKENTEKVAGYNVYLAYKSAGPWFKLNKEPIKGTSQKVGSLYNDVPVYFCVAALSAEKLVESPKSTIIGVTPRAGGATGDVKPAEASGEDKKGK